MSLPADPASAAVARRFVRDALGAWGAEEFEEAAVLLTSELVTNAILHARSAPELTVRLVVGRLRVSVSDATPVTPTRKRYGTEAATGRGLMLIETMATSWGSDASPGGKVVWFELAPADEGPPGAAVKADGDSASGPSEGDGSARPSRRPRPGSGPPSAPRPSARRSRCRNDRVTHP